MTFDFNIVLLLLFSYLLGAIPSGYVIAKLAKGIDIREHGSGNPGSANVYRIVGKWAGWGTLLCDATKGYIPVHMAIKFYPDNHMLAIVCGSVAIMGHMWTVFLKFKGGNGVATSAGVFGAMLPVPILIAAVAFVIAVAVSKHISVGSITAAVVLPVVSFWVGEYPESFSVMVTIVCVLIIYKHIPNIKRLLEKKELAFEDGSAKNTSNDKTK